MTLKVPHPGPSRSALPPSGRPPAAHPYAWASCSSRPGVSEHLSRGPCYPHSSLGLFLSGCTSESPQTALPALWWLLLPLVTGYLQAWYLGSWRGSVWFWLRLGFRQVRLWVWEVGLLSSCPSPEQSPFWSFPPWLRQGQAFSLRCKGGALPSSSQTHKLCITGTGKEGLRRRESFPVRAAPPATQLPAAGVRAAGQGLWVPAALCPPAARKVYSLPSARCQASAV